MAGFGWPVIGLISLLTGLCIISLFPVVATRVEGMWRTVQIRGRLSGRKEDKLWDLLLIDLCTNGIAPARIPARWLCKVSAFAQLVNEAHFVLSHRMPGCTSRALAESLLSFSVLCGAALYLLTGQALITGVCLVLPAVVVRFKTRKWLLERKNKLREQLPDALRGMGMCFMAGLSLEQAFEQTSQECREPLRRELCRTVDDLRTGSSILESLDRLDARLSMDDMRFVSVALEIQHRTGGSMREVLDATADSIVASFDLSRSLEVQTAQARLSARVVSILPVALVVVLSLAMEGYLATFFSSPAGLMLLSCAVGMQVAGIVVIRKILGIDLE